MAPSTWASIPKGPLVICLGNGDFTVNVLDFSFVLACIASAQEIWVCEIITHNNTPEGD